MIVEGEDGRGLGDLAQEASPGGAGPARARKFAYDSVARVRASAGVRSARSGVVALRT